MANTQDKAPTNPQSQAPEKTAKKRTRTYVFPDFDRGGPSVTIEATSLEEATALYKKGQATA